MIGARQLSLFALLFFHSVFGDGENDGKFQITEDLTKDNPRKDAEQDPLTSVKLAATAGSPHSTLFATCIAEGQPFEARFASIEVVPGSEYIRYVPDSLQLSIPISWKNVTGDYTSILDCAKAAHDGGWSMFKYIGTKCKVVNTTYSLKDMPKCEEKDSDAVFILPTAPIEDCPTPRFLVGRDNNDKAVCGLVNTNLMTFDEAEKFCLEAYRMQELMLLVNEHPPLTLQTTIDKFTLLGYTETNLWVGGEQIAPSYFWRGNIVASDWFDGKFPADVAGSYRAAYMDKGANFKFRVSDKSYKAGCICITYAAPISSD